jgi:uncharacterized membrane protein (UPF0127 family)
VSEEVWPQQKRLQTICDTAALFRDCPVMDLKFTSGHQLEVYVAASQEHRARGLAGVAGIDLDGMLFCFPSPSFVPFTTKAMMMPIEIAWYDAQGARITKTTAHPGREPICAPAAFSYVLETPENGLPAGNLVVSRG